MARHLDLGCGENPRNPFRAEELFGVDLMDFDHVHPNLKIKLVKANVFEPLPFEDHSFESISAYDFLEHVPRVLGSTTLGEMQLPFISLMNEIWRLLKPEGIFIASTPAYPHKKAFQDPTHVNIITADTHTYFTGVDPYARRYGFSGHFEVMFADWDAEKNAWDPMQSALGKSRRNLEHILFKGGRSHMTWMFKAIKLQ